MSVVENPISDSRVRSSSAIPSDSDPNAAASSIAAASRTSTPSIPPSNRAPAISAITMMITDWITVVNPL
ncbi:hypothetical protein PA7_15630 [Pseudonocardia asaccharolytica DSM 44247 = NBRC 16224]|uniref:Uncharacterized protein n=1 Tax=Pseudonocardia asaccharolytica DSM 44247 = NBRC 16224 TaxID=1123024 RepID=A0A511CYW9_9PSEU|nr:hypothetical protein PA7_15630 [Pseudonocardia asaccharolytica DSM 44247 = NBRC 16224]